MLNIAAARLRVDIAPGLYAEVAEPGTGAHQEIVRFQQERFSLLSDPDADSDADFVETTDYAPDQSIPMGVYQYNPDVAGPARLVGAARLELSGATVIETMIALRPGTQAAVALAQHQVAEIGGFATALDLDKATLMDVMDALVAIIVRLSRQYGIEWLWIFPRKGMISVLRAAVPELLPPYHFRYCADWQGWQEESPQYRQFRRLGLRGIPDQPQLFQISREEFASDLSRRLALRATRSARAAELEVRYRAAMWQAERDINDEIVRSHHAAHDFGRVIRDELDLRQGMRALNVDCGAGLNLAWLRERAGEHGVVVGLEEDATLVQRARQRSVEPAPGEVMVFEGSSRRLAFPDELFDRIYTDRALARTCDAGGTLAELRRVLAPGGILSVVAPRWETLDIEMGRYGSADDAVVVERLRTWYWHSFRALPRLADLQELKRQAAWQAVRITESHVSFSDLAQVRTLLLLPEASAALGGADETFARQLAAFERRMERAERAVSLVVRVALLSVWAQRPVCPPMPE